jgi:hypothetical protein
MGYNCPYHDAMLSSKRLILGRTTRLWQAGTMMFDRKQGRHPPALPEAGWLCARSMWLAPVKLSPFVSAVGKGEGIRPRKFSGGDAEVFCALTQIIMVEVLISVFAARVVPHAHLRFLPVQLQFLQLGATDRLGLGAAKE